MRSFKNLSVFLLLSLLFCCNSEKESPNNIERTNSLEAAFKNPPSSAKPRTWMHAMSGNMTKAGLTKDLESMAEVGIGGFLLFNITQGIPNGPIKYNSPEHHALIRHAAKEAERLGLSFGVHNCDGWSASGGPWITPEESMKMVVWSEQVVNGGEVKTQLKVPTVREGYYQDIAVIAYPSLPSEVDDATTPAVITASDPNLDLALIADGKVDNESEIKMSGDQEPWIQFSYKKPKTIRSAKLVFNDRHSTAMLQVSEDGKRFKDVRDLFKVRTGKGEWAINDHFEPLTSKYFRLKFNQSTDLKEVQLSATYFVNNLLGRTSIARTEHAQLDPIGKPEPAMVIDKFQIKDISSGMDKDGLLLTELPEGSWTILRFGYTSTGATNNPASKEGKGLEVDKLSRPAFKKHYDAFVKKVVENTREVAPNALQYAEIDSYEMGGQNWTQGFDSLFSAEKGYDIKNFLPLIAGRFVESPQVSEAVLWDFRGVITNLMTNNYYAYFTELCNKDGILSYIEPYGFGPLNDLDIGGKADIPMGEFWMNRPITMVESAVSSAHIYGKPVISAESFTSNPEINWKGNPAMAKNSGDLAWTRGINEFMFHRFAHQANTHTEPGMTMNRWGFHFDRTQTWWENAGAAWFKYIARGSHMLRQGYPVADLLIFIGDGTPNSTFGRNDFEQPIPEKINYDNVNADVLINRINIKDKKLVLPERNAYKVLVLKNSHTLTLPTIKRIHEIAKSGVPVYGEKPERLAGYGNSDKDRKTFKTLANELATLIKDQKDWDEVLRENKLSADMDIQGRTDISYAHRKTPHEDIYFFFNPDSIPYTFNVTFRVNKKIPELWNPLDGSIKKMGQFTHSDSLISTNIRLNAGESVFVVFRESSEEIKAVASENKNVEILLNEKNQLEATIWHNDSYTIPLISGETWNFEVKDIPEPLKIEGSWQVQFQKGSGYGGNIQFDSLIDWKDHPLDSINYYSGTATYTKKINVLADFIGSDNKILLDLGQVNIVAEVKVNGENAGIVWMPPFQLDVSDYIKEGENTLEIAVTNLWSNRLIGDERFPANDDYSLESHNPTGLMPQWYVNNEPRPEGQRTTFTTAPFYKKDDPLMPSGLVGPVRLLGYKKINYQP